MPRIAVPIRIVPRDQPPVGLALGLAALVDVVVVADRADVGGGRWSSSDAMPPTSPAATTCAAG